jgi:hypothetical protein
MFNFVCDFSDQLGTKFSSYILINIECIRGEEQHESSIVLQYKNSDYLLWLLKTN